MRELHVLELAAVSVRHLHVAVSDDCPDGEGQPEELKEAAEIVDGVEAACA